MLGTRKRAFDILAPSPSDSDSPDAARPSLAPPLPAAPIALHLDAQDSPHAPSPRKRRRKSLEPAFAGLSLTQQPVSPPPPPSPSLYLPGELPTHSSLPSITANYTIEEPELDEDEDDVVEVQAELADAEMGNTRHSSIVYVSSLDDSPVLEPTSPEISTSFSLPSLDLLPPSPLPPSILDSLKQEHSLGLVLYRPPVSETFKKQLEDGVKDEDGVGGKTKEDDLGEVEKAVRGGEQDDSEGMDID
ncbi:hypothetical protein MNV49_001521 [Pseudohyphozyma bogoriensis]|nr:hypothetical protein MNV49_001521 [Pseudohyphozyma bogoriensis]